jgi:hypothetical protein
MFAIGELNAMARRRAALRVRIGAQRSRCIEAAAIAAQPFAWLDEAMIQWRRFSPLLSLAALPWGLAMHRRVGSTAGRIGTLLRWAPTLFAVGQRFLKQTKRRP